MVIIKILLVMVLIIPTIFITALIWVFGGWTKGWDYMPNPVYSLIEWLENSF